MQAEDSLTKALTANQKNAKDVLPSDGEVIQPTNFSASADTHTKKTFRLKPLYSVTAVALFILSAIAGFLFVAKSVTFDTQPAFADVKISDGMVIPFGENYLLLRGDYKLSATALGYADLQQSLEVGSEQNQVVTLQLKKLPGQLTVAFNDNKAGNSNNTGNASSSGEVWIDGELRGTVNEIIENISAGEHRIDVVTDRYLPFSSSIEIAGLNQHQTFNADLQPAWANVAFTTEPIGAELYVDNQLVATTPVVAEILQGERNISVKLPGYKSWYDVIAVEANESISVAPITLQLAEGLILVESTPAQASVTINNDYRGQTPVEVALAPGNTYEITLFKDGFQPAQRNVTITSGATQSLAVNLTPQLGQIQIKSTPGDALLYVNGRLMGRADQVLSLPASQTQISIKKEGYTDYNTTVLPRPNLEQLVNINLRTIEDAKWENIPNNITTQVGQNLKLFKPDHTFTMGSSRREQGRRANEALHNVELTRAFYLGTHEVTNRQFRQFKSQHSSGNVKGNSLNSEEHPVVNVTWQSAALYCNWLSEQEKLPSFYIVEEGEVNGFNPQSIGYRLATETEWAWSARLQHLPPEQNSPEKNRSDRLLKFSWGPQLPPTERTANIADRNAVQLVGYIQVDYDDDFAATSPVGSYSSNEKGLYDLDGNVAEWVNDYYDVPSSVSQKTDKDPIGPNGGLHHVIRGSSWAHGSITELRLSFRDYGIEARNDVGFRIARFAE